MKSLTERVVTKFRTSGVLGVGKAVLRKVVPGPVGPPTFPPMNIALDAVMAQPGFVIMQLGAFIGDTGNDPLFRGVGKRLQETGGKLILVEPVRDYYEQLVKNYEGIPGVAFENVAVSDRSGPATFYRLGVDPVAHGYPDWLSQLSSLKEERMKDLWDRFEADQRLKEFYLRHRVQETVECITFSELVGRHGVRKIDLLQIDVEGYELEILRSIDFRKVPTRFVNYEYTLLQKNKALAERLMRKSGYRLVDYGHDTFCYTRRDRSLAKLWR